MREIKFRAWIKDFDSGEFGMIDWFPEFFSDMSPITSWGSEFPSDEPDVILMQFTGLLDKNGKEIYEGDIVRKYNCIAVVCWQAEGVNGWCIEEEMGNPYKRYSLYEGDTLLEIVGNIYENPEHTKDMP